MKDIVRRSFSGPRPLNWVTFSFLSSTRKDTTSMMFTVVHSLDCVSFSIPSSTKGTECIKETTLWLTSDPSFCIRSPVWRTNLLSMYVSVILYHSGNPISNSSETSSRGQVTRPQLGETTTLTDLGRRTHVNVMFKTTGVIAITTPPSPTPCSDDEEMFMSFKKITGVGRMETCEKPVVFFIFSFLYFFFFCCEIFYFFILNLITNLDIF